MPECSKEKDVCGKCSEEGHRTNECFNTQARCANCKEDRHEAYSSTCPIFIKKLKEMHNREYRRKAADQGPTQDSRKDQL
jgi:hypothetical protein